MNPSHFQNVSLDNGIQNGRSEVVIRVVIRVVTFFSCISEMLLQQAKPDLTLLDVNNNTALHLACSKVPLTQHNC